MWQRLADSSRTPQTFRDVSVEKPVGLHLLRVGNGDPTGISWRWPLALLSRLQPVSAQNRGAGRPAGVAMNVLASKAQLRASFLRWALFMVPLVLLIGFAAGQLGGPDTAWFAGLEKPAIYPPPITFGIVWTVLFILIGCALALVASAWGAPGRGLALAVFAVQFLVTQSWSAVFFGMQDMQTGLYVIIGAAALLLIALPLIWRVRRVAALLLLPYLGWVCFAGALNYAFIAANPDGGERGATGAATRVEL
jgi:tryptophan-rich sensory protein